MRSPSRFGSHLRHLNGTERVGMPARDSEIEHLLHSNAGAVGLCAKCQKQTLSGQARRSRGANIAGGPDPPFGHVADLIACHCGKIIT
jgi:hypothetical protein